MRVFFLLQPVIALLLCGCATTEQTPVVVEEDDAMLHLGSKIRPENLLFPDYLFMPDFELDQHGRIPGSTVVGAGLKTKLGLHASLERFSEVLGTNSWVIASQEAEDQSFRLKAEKRGDTLEIRAVQGSGPTEVFILYHPKSVAPSM